MSVLVFYVALFLLAFFIVRFLRGRLRDRNDLTSLKTVTFGDESAVTPDRAASIISVISIFFIWGAFTGSSLVPIHVPGPYSGTTEFTYTAENAAGERDSAVVRVLVHGVGEDPDPPEIEEGSGFAINDSATVATWRSELVRIKRNDIGGDEDGYRVVEVEGQRLSPDDTVRVPNGTVTMTARGSLSFEPDAGMQMEPIWLPSPEAVASRFFEIASQGYQNFTLLEHLGWSLLPGHRGLLLRRAHRHTAGLCDGAVGTGSAAGSIPSSNSCARCRRWR
jgi:taurine transport system permease protein